MDAVSALPVMPPNEFIPLPRLPSFCTAMANRLSDRIWERRFNITTTGRRAARQGDAERYESVPYIMLFRMMEKLQLGPGDVVVDIGSGMGRPVCVAASYPIARAVGVELEPDLHEVAAANAARARRLRAPAEVHCMNAVEFDYREATVLLFFNPFGDDTMRLVLARIEESLRRSPRTIRIGYVNARCAHVFAEQPWIEVDDHWPMTVWSRIKTPIHFYRTKPVPASNTTAAASATACKQRESGRSGA